MASLVDMEELAGEYADSLFARGYIVSRRNPMRPEGWREDKFDDFVLSYHPRLQFSYSRTTDALIMCLGIIFDSRFPDVDQQDYLDELSRALSCSEQKMFELLEHSNGRYVLIYRGRDGRPYLLHDATGMRSAVYHVGEQVTVSSHLTLLDLDAALNGERDNRASKFGFPGRLTPNRDVLMLTPNTKLCMNTGKIQRYWPMMAVPQSSLIEAAETVSHLLQSSFEWVNRRYDHFATLTAGLDSRVTLSIIKNKTRYATYYRNDEVDTDEVDRRVTQQLGLDLHLAHTLLGPETRADVPKSFSSVIKFNTFRSHIPKMAWAYLQTMVKDPSETVHIRSNLSEVGRLFYKARGSNPKNGRDLNTLWSPNEDLHTEENTAAFQEFADATGFFQTPVEHTSLFYWEHRMGQWHSQVPLESDVACETLSLYNCRRILATMWSVSEKAQGKSLLLKRIVAARWSALTKYDLNGKPFDPASSKDRSSVYEGLEPGPALLKD